TAYVRLTSFTFLEYEKSPAGERSRRRSRRRNLRGAAGARLEASDTKALAAAALALDVRIAELERLVQPFLDEIDLGAVDERQALAVDDDLDVPVVEDDVVRVDLVRVVEVIGPPGAAGALDADSQTDAVSALLQVALHSPNGVLRQRYRHGCPLVSAFERRECRFRQSLGAGPKGILDPEQLTEFLLRDVQRAPRRIDVKAA